MHLTMARQTCVWGPARAADGETGQRARSRVSGALGMECVLARELTHALPRQQRLEAQRALGLFSRRVGDVSGLGQSDQRRAHRHLHLLPVRAVREVRLRRAEHEGGGSELALQPGLCLERRIQRGRHHRREVDQAPEG